MLTSKIAIAGIVVGGLAVGCQEAATAPRRAASGPRFATASDTGGGGGGGKQFHFVSNGDFGNVAWSDSEPSGAFSFGSLSVGRGGTVSAPQTFLSYFIIQCDAFFNCTLLDGFGLIPNADLSGKVPAKQLHLSTNTTGNPNFFTFDGPTGLITVDWKANGFFTQSFSGTSKVTFQFAGVNERLNQQGSFTDASASAAGSVVGTAISPFNGAQIGSSHNVTIDIFH